jgi:hypothetical protein
MVALLRQGPPERVALYEDALREWAPRYGHL